MDATLDWNRLNRLYIPSAKSHEKLVAENSIVSYVIITWAQNCRSTKIFHYIYHLILEYSWKCLHNFLWSNRQIFQFFPFALALVLLFAGEKICVSKYFFSNSFEVKAWRRKWSDSWKWNLKPFPWKIWKFSVYLFNQHLKNVIMTSNFFGKLFMKLFLEL